MSLYTKDSDQILLTSETNLARMLGISMDFGHIDLIFILNNKCSKC